MAFLALMAVPAAASTHPKPVFSASAFWTTADPSGGVSVQVDEQHGRHAQAGPFLFVTQEFCDTTHDEMVFRNFVSTDPLGPSESTVDTHLRFARLDADVTVAGTEQRLEGCASPTGIPQTTDLGTFRSEIDVLWFGQGAVHDVQPGIVARDANAFGAFSIGRHATHLGKADTAELRRTELP